MKRKKQSLKVFSSKLKILFNRYKIATILTIVLTISSIILVIFMNLHNIIYTIQFESNGGSLIEKQSIKVGNTIVKPVIPTKIGFTFVEWQVNGKKYDLGTPIDENLVLMALWVVDDDTIICTAFFSGGNGEKIKKIEVSKGGKLTPPITPIKKGYIFDGWFYNNNKYDFSMPVNEDILLEAKWVKQINNSNVKNSGSSSDESVNENNLENDENSNVNPPNETNNDDNQNNPPKPEIDNIVKVEGINIDCPSDPLPVGKNMTLAANIIPSNATNKEIMWYSSDSLILNSGWQSGSSNIGLIYANGVGTATITAKTNDGSHTASCTLSTLSSTVTSLSLNISSGTVNAKSSLWVTPTLTPSYAYNTVIYWSSSDPSIAAVTDMSHSGRDIAINGISPGFATITARTNDGDYTSTVQVEVKKVDVRSISIDGCVLNMYIGNTYSLTAKITPFDATNTDVIWSTKYPDMATISPEGLIKSNNSGRSVVVVTPIKSVPYKVGVVTVTTIDGSKSAVCTFGIPFYSE